MSVYPEFIQHIHDIGIYVPGYNYEEMYNIMVYNLTYNIISTNNFVYTYAQMNQLYDYLEELLLPQSDSDIEIEPESNTNNVNNINIITQNTNDALQLFTNYIITSLNNTNTNNTNNTNIYPNNNTNIYPNNNEFTYTDLVYYNNT